MFQPVLPFTGYVGWRFLERTLETQKQTFAASQPVTRVTEKFRQEISGIKTAEDLVANRELLSVALGAFGLDDDLDNKFFIKKILSEGSVSDDGLANRLANKSYLALTAAFGFGDIGGPFTNLTGFAERIIAKYEAKQFERAVGEQNNDLRLALSVKEGLDDITLQSKGQDAQWFAIMGNPPIRKIFEMALGLPSSIAQIDLDQQLGAFQSRAEKLFGTKNISDFKDPALQERLLQTFLIRSELSNTSALSGGSIALTLLQTR